jgi:hypothetical protein
VGDRSGQVQCLCHDSILRTLSALVSRGCLSQPSVAGHNGRDRFG